MISVHDLTSQSFKWRLSSSDPDSGAVDLPVPYMPISVHQVLWHHGIIEHPYGGGDDREIMQYWISLTSSWTFEMDRSWPLIILVKKALDTVVWFCGLDTLTDVFILASDTCNPQRSIHAYLGTTDNMFRRYRFCLGENTQFKDLVEHTSDCESSIELRFQIEIRSPLHGSKEIAQRHHPGYRVTCPAYIHTVDTTHRNYLRKCGMDFGWDWGFAAMTSSVYKPIYVVVGDNPLILEDVTVFQSDHDINGNVCRRVKLRVVVHMFCQRPAMCLEHRLHISLRDDSGAVLKDETIILNVSREVDQQQQQQFSQDVELYVEDVKLWWPAGYGGQHLYSLEVKLTTDEHGDNIHHLNNRQMAIGIRTFELDQSADNIGRRFQFVINGVPIFSKGANWIPADVFHTRVSVTHLERLLSSARDAHMNTLRVWGGGIYEQDAFYKLCSELGIMVWQDFAFACSMYPAHREFLDNVRHEVRDQVRRLQHHACIVLWAGNNENEAALHSWPECQEQGEQLKLDYDRLYYDTIYDELLMEDPHRPFVPSSPSNGIRRGGDPQDLTEGDCHYWAVWHGGMPFTTYQSVTPRFCSEFGFQSIPHVSSLAPFLPNPRQDLSINSRAMEYRQRSYAAGNKCLMEHIQRELPMPQGFHETVYCSQVNQANAIRMAVEHWRRKSDICAGALFWQLNDCWVGNSWSSIEWNGQWKLLHYQACQFFAPVLLSVEQDQLSNELNIWLTSDLRDCAVEGDLLVELRSYATGQVLRSWNRDAVIQKARTSSPILTLDMTDAFLSDRPDSSDPNDYEFYKRMADGKATIHDNRYWREDCFLVASLDGIHTKDDKDPETLLEVKGYQNIVHHFVELKKARLRTSDITLRIQRLKSSRSEVAIMLESSTPIFHVSLELENDDRTDEHVHTAIDRVVLCPGRFNDNNFSLLPGQKKRVVFHVQDNTIGPDGVYHFRRTFLERLRVHALPCISMKDITLVDTS